MESTESAGQSRMQRLKAGIDWQETGLFGAGAWLIGLVLSYVLVTVADLQTGGQDTIDVAVQAYFEGMGGIYEASSTGSVIRAVYGAESSNFWGLGAFLHYVIPAVVFVVAGYALAGRYVEAGETDSFQGKLQAWVGGVSLAAIVAVLTVIGAYGFTPPSADPHGLRLLLAAIVTPTVYAGIGAARQVGFGIRSLGGLGYGLLSLVLAFVLWEFVEDPFGGAVDVGDLSGADEYLPYVGHFLADHGVAITPGQAFVDNSGFGSMGNIDVGLVGGADPAFVLFLAPAAVAGALVYRADVDDPIVGLGRGARVALGYFLGVAILAFAVLGQRMNYLYDELYGTGSEEAVREQLIQHANMMGGGVLPEVLLVAGVLWPVLFAGIGGVVGAKAVEMQAQDQSVQTGQPQPEQSATQEEAPASGGDQPAASGASEGAE